MKSLLTRPISRALCVNLRVASSMHVYSLAIKKIYLLPAFYFWGVFLQIQLPNLLLLSDHLCAVTAFLPTLVGPAGRFE